MSIWGGGYLNKRKIPDRLEKFDRYKKQKRIAIASVIGLFLLTGVVHLYKTFAFYEEKKTFNVIRGRVPDFRIKYTILLNNVASSNIPAKDQGGVFSGYSCNKTGVTIQWDSGNWKPIASGPKGVGISCTLKFETRAWDSASIGDYVSYTPSNTSYTAPSNLTGYTYGEQTINPSELNLWRIIRKNNDGTVDAVSEYVSSKDVYIIGKIGYEKLVGTLNTIAKQYETSGKTVGSRHMGYSGQTATVTINTATTPSWAEIRPPQKSSDVTTAEAQELKNGGPRERAGGGDIGYLVDLELVRAAVGDTMAARVDSGKRVIYRLASRRYRSGSYFGIAVSNADGSVMESTFSIYPGSPYLSSGLIRPIVVFGSSLNVTNGTKNGKSLWIVS